MRCCSCSRQAEHGEQHLWLLRQHPSHRTSTSSCSKLLNTQLGRQGCRQKPRRQAAAHQEHRSWLRLGEKQGGQRGQRTRHHSRHQAARNRTGDPHKSRWRERLQRSMWITCDSAVSGRTR